MKLDHTTAAHSDGTRVALTIPQPGKENKKVGLIPVSTTTATTCPDSCPLKHRGTEGAAGCYAASGPLALHWRKVTEGARGMLWDAFCDAIAALPVGQAWRHNQAGDMLRSNDSIDTAKLAQLVDANRGKMGWTYTHKPMSDAGNREAVAAANERGFIINLSANNLAEADSLASLNVGPVVVVLDAEEGERADTVTPEGRKVITCPATYRDNVNCKSCLLCARGNRKTIVGFPGHGSGKKRARAIARGGK